MHFHLQLETSINLGAISAVEGANWGPQSNISQKYYEKHSGICHSIA